MIELEPGRIQIWKLGEIVKFLILIHIFQDKNNFKKLKGYGKKSGIQIWIRRPEIAGFGLPSLNYDFEYGFGFGEEIKGFRLETNGIL